MWLVVVGILFFMKRGLAESSSSFPATPGFDIPCGPGPEEKVGEAGKAARVDEVVEEEEEWDPVRARWANREVYRFAMEHLLPEKDQVIVDVGTGSGHKLIEMLGHHKKTYGLERAKQIERFKLKERYPDRAWIAVDEQDELNYGRIAKDLPRHIDLLLCIDLMDHVQDEAALADFLKHFPYKTLLVSVTKSYTRMAADPAWLSSFTVRSKHIGDNSMWWVLDPVYPVDEPSYVEFGQEFIPYSAL